MRVDLHTHSSVSDGTLPPAAVMAEARAAGLDVVGLTDHDNTAGWAEAVAALPAGLTLVPGVELSCRWYGSAIKGEGAPPPSRSPDFTEPSIALHLLGYLFDPDHPDLVAALAGVRRSRETRAERMVALLRADGIDVTFEEILGSAGGGSIGRPHLARALVRRGLVGSVSEAFEPRWLGARYRLPKEDLDVFRAIDLVRAAGGVTVFAHPRASVRGRIVPDSLIVELAAAGLAGLEVDHDDHGDADRARLRRLAADLGLLVTGSSDFHGANKDVRLGANTTDPEQFEKLVAAASFGRPVAA